MRKFGGILQILIRYYWLPDLIPPLRIRSTSRFGSLTPPVQGPVSARGASTTGNRICKLVGIVMGVTAAIAMAIPAAADGPTKAPVINTPGELDGFCSFPVGVSLPANHETMKTFYDSAGNPIRTLIDGRLVVTFTNLSDPTKTVTENLSGPGQISYDAYGNPTTFTFLGNSAVFLLVAGSQPTLLLTSGRVVTMASSLTGLGILVSAVGRTTNICSLLS